MVVGDALWDWAKGYGAGQSVSVSEVVRQALEEKRARVEKGAVMEPGEIREAPGAPVMEPPGTAIEPGVMEPQVPRVMEPVSEAPTRVGEGEPWVDDWVRFPEAGQTREHWHPEAFEVGPSGDATWKVWGWRFHFPAARRDEWASVVGGMRQIGNNPERDPIGWGSVAPHVLRWLRPERLPQEQPAHGEPDLSF